MSETNKGDLNRPATVAEVLDLITPLMKSIAETGSAVIADRRDDGDAVRVHMSSVLESLKQVRNSVAEMVGATVDNDHE